MDKESIRLSLNKFLKMYYDSCEEVYKEINFGRITGKQFKYLKEIHLREEVTQTELATTFCVSKPTMNEFIHKFYDSGIVKKRKCTEDKRVSYISLTEVGKTLATTNVLESKRATDKIIAKLNNEEIKALVTLFDRFEGEEK